MAFKGVVIVGATSVSGIHCSGLEASAHSEGLMDPLLDAVKGQGSLWRTILASTHVNEQVGELIFGLPCNREYVRDISCMHNFRIEPLAWLLYFARWTTLAKGTMVTHVLASQDLPVRSRRLFL